MKKRHVYIIIATLLILLGLFFGATPDRIKIDGLSGEISDLLLATDTKYADGYSHADFNRIKIGMTEHEVLDILGEPLTRWTPYLHTMFQDKAHYVGLQYSESPSSTHYRLRQVYLDNGVVAEIIGYFYVD